MSEQDSAQPARSGWRVLQLRSLLSRYLAAVVVVLFVLALVGGLLTYNTHIDPGTETQTVQESSWSSTGEYAHEAAVVSETDVFERGTVFSDQSTYLGTIAPVLDGSFAYQYEATDGGDLQTDIDVVLVVRSVGEEGFEFWREERDLASQSASGVQPGDRVTASFSINVTAVNQRIAEIERQLGPTPGNAQISVESRVNITGERNGQQVDQRRTYTMDVIPGEAVYSVENDDPTQNGDEQFGRETTTASYGFLRGSIPPIVLLGAVVAGVGVGVARFREQLHLSEPERRWLGYCTERAEFEEWISAGRLSEETLPERRVELSSLGGLVDLAIDSNRRVVEDDSRGTYAVLVEDVAYVYERPDPPTDAEEPLSALGGGTARPPQQDGTGEDEEVSDDETSDGDETANTAE